jgi:hypothetical protein
LKPRNTAPTTAAAKAPKFPDPMLFSAGVPRWALLLRATKSPYPMLLSAGVPRWALLLRAKETKRVETKEHRVRHSRHQSSQVSITVLRGSNFPQAGVETRERGRARRGGAEQRGAEQGRERQGRAEPREAGQGRAEKIGQG